MIEHSHDGEWCPPCVEHGAAENRAAGIDALQEFVDFEFHEEGCPAAEWSGIRPACRCGWDEAVAALRVVWPELELSR